MIVDSCFFIDNSQVKIYMMCSAVALGGYGLYKLYQTGLGNIYHNIKSYGFKLLRKIPKIEKEVQDEIAKSVQKISQELKEPVNNYISYHQLPKEGKSTHCIKLHMEEMEQVGNFNCKQGSASGTVYSNNPDLHKLWIDVFPIFSRSNPLHPDLFPGLRKMEQDVVRMSINLFNGDGSYSGCFASGGTESILLACKAYRDWGRTQRGITKPEIIVASSAHCAFDKACHYFNIKMIKIDVEKETGMMDLKKLPKKISRRTILIVGSAPSFPHGIIDPIKEMSEIALKHNVPLHVDCCLGGFLLPFVKEALDEDIDFDFRLKGVTSISADCHKYGYCPKGSSVIMYRNKELIHNQYYVNANWMGGIYATSTLIGSRSGNIIALTWATMMKLGRSGYVAETKRIVELTRYFANQLVSLSEQYSDSIYILGNPKLNVVAIGSKYFDIYELHNNLLKQGWAFNALQFPASIHLCITQCHTREVIDQILVAIEEYLCDITIKYQDNPDKTEVMINEKSSSIYGSSQQISDRSIVEDVARGYLDNLCN